MFELFIEKFNIQKTSTISGEDVFVLDNSIVNNALEELKNFPEYGFDILLSYFAVDRIEENCFEIFYELYSLGLNKNLILKTTISRDNAQINSITNIFASAVFDEREMYDLFGINFVGHKNLRRILLPNDWIGYPLRKDYQQTDERLVWNVR